MNECMERAVMEKPFCLEDGVGRCIYLLQFLDAPRCKFYIMCLNMISNHQRSFLISVFLYKSVLY